MTKLKTAESKERLQYNRLISVESADYSVNFVESSYGRKKPDEIKIGHAIIGIGLLFVSACFIVYFTTSMAAKPADEITITKEEKALITELSVGNVEFTKNLYSIVSKEPGNIFCSPLSLELALLLAYNGASGNTSAEIKKALSLPDSKDDVLKGAEALIKLFHKTDNVTLNIANGIFLHEIFKVKQEYLESSKKHFSAVAQNVNFGKSQEAASVINGFVDKHTNHKITELFSPDAFDALTRVVLVNAVYFLGNWSKKFNSDHTYKGPFHLNNQTKVQVDFMKQTSQFEYAENDDLNVTVLKLPYAGNEVSMILLIPREIEGLPELETKIKDLDLIGLARNVRRREINLHLPKFKLEKTLNLEKTLQELGLGEMFDANKAKFENLSDEPLFVQKVVQKAYIEVDEKGTEAAAATGILISNRMAIRPLPPKEIKADRPFLFYLLQQSSGLPLFIGRLNFF